MRELISVICTVKNGENIIANTIKSVLQQTYKNFEFIIIDDGSTDNTLNLLYEYQEKDERLKIYPTVGLGRSKALNMAVQYCAGEFIANIDADDLFHPQKLEIQMKVISQYGECFLVSTESQIIYDSEMPSWHYIELDNKAKHSTINSKLLIKNQISHPSVLMRRKFLLELNSYNEKRSNQIDYDLWLRAFSQGYKMLFIDLKLVGKRIHSKQSFENKNRLKYTFSSMVLQLKFIFLNRRLHLVPIPVINFVFAQLPFRVRRHINSTLLENKA